MKLNAGVIYYATGLDGHGDGIYKIREIVTPQGHWIEWEGVYTTADAAYAEIRRIQNKS